MSDHEGGHDDYWGDDTTDAADHTYSVVSRAGQEPFSNPIPPRGPNGQRHRDLLRPAPAQQRLDPSYRPAIQAATGISQRSGGIKSRRAYLVPEPPRPQIENDARRDCESGQPSAGRYTLAVPWGSFLRNIPRESFERKRQLPENVARAGLDEICQRNNTFISTPPDSSCDIQVWGDDEDVERTLAELRAYETDIRQRHFRPSRQNWTKERAHDGRVEDRAIRNLRAEELQAAMFHQNQQTSFQFQAHLLWDAKVDMKEFRQKYENTVLRSLQAKSECRIEFLENEPKHVKISTNEEKLIFTIYQRVINLVKETIAQNGLFSRLNRFRIPRSSMFRDKVGLDRHPHKPLMIPTLFGEPLPRHEQLLWEQLRKNGEKSNQAMLKTELDSIIRAIQAPGQQVRMRVVFTELGFSRHEAPPDGQEYHGIEDFMEMMVKPLVEIDMAGLREDCDLGKLVDVLSEMEQFEHLGDRYTLHFDFHGTSNSTLRYEREMYTGYEDELEDEAKRWLQFSNTPNENEILEFNVLDFEHLAANYQVHIGKAALVDATDKQRKFENGVQYKHDPLGLKARPRRRAVFPPGYDNLKEHRETTIARFNFKGPDARFELVRRDTFRGKESGRLPTDTMWFAQYYYPEWDYQLGEFGNLKPGDPVSWPKRLETFFKPENSVDDNRPLPQGFRAFMSEIEEIQGCLQHAIEQLMANGKGKRRESSGGANGLVSAVNGMKVG